MKQLQSIYWGLVALFVLSFSSCQQDNTNPQNQNYQFAQNYTLGGKSESADFKQTNDLGYIIVGNTDLNSTTNETSAAVIKTDSLGTLEWNVLLRKSNYFQGSTYVRCEEEAVKVETLPNNTGYVIGVNRSYNYYQNQTDNTPFDSYNKVVFYELDLTGNVLKNTEMRNDTLYSDVLYDFALEQDTANSTVTYVMTGYTTKIFTGKPGGPSSTDSKDILLMRLNHNFDKLWSDGVSAYGFLGEDIGSAVTVNASNIYVFGITKQSTYNNAANLICISVNQSNGAILNTHSINDSDYEFSMPQADYDATNNKINVAMGVMGGNNTNVGSVAFLQLNNSFIVQNPNPSNTNAMGLEFHQPAGPSTLPGISSHKYVPTSIYSHSNDVLTSLTHENTAIDKDIVGFKIDNQYQAVSG